jgi:hypothetical protein
MTQAVIAALGFGPRFFGLIDMPDRFALSSSQSATDRPCHRCPETRIDMAGIVAVNMTKCSALRVRVRRHGDDMHMIWHQAAGPDFDAVP